MNLTQMQTRVVTRLGEDQAAASGNRFYTDAEATSALNTAQRIFVLLTLCLEGSTTFALTERTPYYRVLTQISDWILPLRFNGPDGSKIRPATIADFASLDATWSLQYGSLTLDGYYTPRYAMLGFDLLGFYPAPLADMSVTVRYARAAALLASGGDVPEIPEQHHQTLVDGAGAILSVKEGAQALEKGAAYWQAFLDGASALATTVRARYQQQGYDNLPYELTKIRKSGAANG